jgi:hypothetical protein
MSGIVPIELAKSGLYLKSLLPRVTISDFSALNIEAMTKEHQLLEEPTDIGRQYHILIIPIKVSI